LDKVRRIEEDIFTTKIELPSLTSNQVFWRDVCSVAKHLLQSVIPEDGNLTISATEGMASAMPKAHAQLPSPNKKTTDFLFQVCCPERSRGESVP